MPNSSLPDYTTVHTKDTGQTVKSDSGQKARFDYVNGKLAQVGEGERGTGFALGTYDSTFQSPTGGSYTVKGTSQQGREQVLSDLQQKQNAYSTGRVSPQPKQSLIRSDLVSTMLPGYSTNEGEVYFLPVAQPQPNFTPAFQANLSTPQGPEQVTYTFEKQQARPLYNTREEVEAGRLNPYSSSSTFGAGVSQSFEQRAPQVQGNSPEELFALAGRTAIQTGAGIYDLSVELFRNPASAAYVFAEGGLNTFRTARSTVTEIGQGKYGLASRNIIIQAVPLVAFEGVGKFAGGFLKSGSALAQAASKGPLFSFKSEVTGGRGFLVSVPVETAEGATRTSQFIGSFGEKGVRTVGVNVELPSLQNFRTAPSFLEVSQSTVVPRFFELGEQYRLENFGMRQNGMLLEDVSAFAQQEFPQFQVGKGPRTQGVTAGSQSLVYFKGKTSEGAVTTPIQFSYERVPRGLPTQEVDLDVARPRVTQVTQVQRSSPVLSSSSQGVIRFDLSAAVSNLAVAPSEAFGAYPLELSFKPAAFSPQTKFSFQEGAYFTSPSSALEFDFKPTVSGTGYSATKVEVIQSPSFKKAYYFDLTNERLGVTGSTQVQAFGKRTIRFQETTDVIEAAKRAGEVAHRPEKRLALKQQQELALRREYGELTEPKSTFKRTPLKFSPEASVFSEETASEPKGQGVQVQITNQPLIDLKSKSVPIVRVGLRPSQVQSSYVTEISYQPTLLEGGPKFFLQGKEVSLGLREQFLLKERQGFSFREKESTAQVNAQVSAYKSLQLFKVQPQKFSEALKERQQERIKERQGELQKFRVAIAEKVQTRQVTTQATSQLTVQIQPGPKTGKPPSPKENRNPKPPKPLEFQKPKGEDELKKRRRQLVIQLQQTVKKTRQSFTPEIDLGSRTVAAFRYGYKAQFGQLSSSARRADYQRTAGLAVRTPAEIKEANSQRAPKLSIGFRK